VRLIAERTRAVGRLIHYPCIVVLLMILSRHSITDHWDWPLPLVLLISLNLGGAISCAVILRLTAGKARQTVLRRLNDRISCLAGVAAQSGDQTTKASPAEEKNAKTRKKDFKPTADPKPPEAQTERKDAQLEQLNLIIREIKQEDRGAFSPFMNNPVLLALAWPFAGYGGMLLTERLLSLL
jgi:hypothetical protein